MKEVSTISKRKSRSRPQNRRQQPRPVNKGYGDAGASWHKKATKGFRAILPPIASILATVLPMLTQIISTVLPVLANLIAALLPVITPLLEDRPRRGDGPGRAAHP